MVWKSYDLSRFSSMLGIFLIGGGFSFFLAADIISIVAKTVVKSDIGTITMQTTSLIITIGATILFIIGCLFLILDSNAAKSEGISVDRAVRFKVSPLTSGSLIVACFALIINALIPV
ncbi:MAG: hypothetical protein JSU57_02275 [Candidatus Heimdallarchaeota archaeon]|nr:MAG: hypothetical protein JSU57_02275 [Candidatus Heimdallarchaeota archaeon]